MKKLLTVWMLLSVWFSVQAEGYVIINQIMYDTPLNEVITTPPYSNGEYVELYNASTEAVSLSGWVLKGGGSTETYQFSDSIQIPSGSYMVVAYRHSTTPSFLLDSLYGQLVTTPNRQVLYQRKIVLSNSGESLTLRNAQGALVDSVFYDGTSNKRKPDRLSADNADSIPGDSCRSIRRLSAQFNRFGQVLPGTSTWKTDKLELFSTVFTLDPQIPDNFVTGGESLPTGSNYVVSVTPLDVTDRVTFDQGTPSLAGQARAVTTVTYYDGLGRPMQMVQPSITPEKSDLVALTEYDGLDRAYRQWLATPMANNDGQIVNSTTLKSAATSFFVDTNPYAETLYEPSALNRTIGQKNPGAAWHGNPTGVSYGTNAESDVKSYSVSTAGALTCSGDYAPNQLYKTVAMDEDFKKVTQFVDKLGRTVLERRDADYDTYYVYDDLGRLRYVLPPLAADGLTSGTYTETNDIVKQFGYVYRYDARGNLTYKRLPGCEPVYMVYDKANRLVLSQDGNQRVATSKRWIVTKYDSLGRVIYTGTINREISAAEREQVSSLLLFAERYEPQTSFEGTGYTCRYFRTEVKPLTVNYYDTYDFLQTLPNDTATQLTYEAKDGNDVAYGNAKGLLTGTRVYNLTDGTYSTTAVYYDQRGRVVQSRSTSNSGGYDIVYSAYNFDGTVRKTLQEHGVRTAPILERYAYTYDHAGRLLKTDYQLGSDEVVTLAQNSYDEQGRLVSKKRHNATDTETFDYNIRNWITHITSGSFQEHIGYPYSEITRDPYGMPHFGPSFCYNGNISSCTFVYDTVSYSFKYRYDELNRLTMMKKRTNQYDSGDKPRETFQYDKMGNITSLQRYNDNNVDIDDLTLDYVGNQLQSINDTSDPSGSYDVKEYQNLADADMEFQYDGNGNFTSDLDRKIATIRYNLLNLPDTIQFANGNQIVNTYNASGRKLKTRYFTVLEPVIVERGSMMQLTYQPDSIDESGTVYDGQFEYPYTKREKGSPGLITRRCRIHNPEGYVERTQVLQNIWHVYNYYRRDHLGNNCAVWDATNDTTLQQTVYYASGLPMAVSSGQSTQPYKYNGKEFIEMHGYDTYDYGFRGYYPAVGRFTTVDPLAEKYYSISPYVYCAGNPVNKIDIDGRDWYEQDDESVVFYEEDDKDKKGERLGATVNGITTEDDFVYGDQFGHIWDSAPIPEVVSTAKWPEALLDMLCASELGIYEGQREFLEHPVTEMVVGGVFMFTGGLELLKIGVDVAVTAWPTLKMAALDAAVATSKAINYTYNNLIMKSIGLGNAAELTQLRIGIGAGVVQAYLPYDAPSIKTGIPTIDAMIMATQISILTKDIVTDK